MERENGARTFLSASLQNQRKYFNLTKLLGFLRTGMSALRPYMNNDSEYQPRGWHSRGYLPHFDGGEILQFITIRLADSLPSHLLEIWREELEAEKVEDKDAALRKRIEYYLDEGHGNCFLQNKEVAEVVKNSLLHLNGKKYRLIAWVIMPNHIHFLAMLLHRVSLSSMMQVLKGFSAREANKLLERGGAFWQADYFDRYIRNEKHFHATIAYIENNPVKANLCAAKEDWFFSSAYLEESKESEQERGHSCLP
jgi:REP element-mobilizing transposase RayT